MVYKTQFSASEAKAIRSILQELTVALTGDKKALRGTLRKKYGFYISFFDSSNMGFDADKFDALIRSGIIKVINLQIIKDDLGVSSKIDKPKSQKKTSRNAYIVKESNNIKDHKLQPIAEMIVAYLEEVNHTKTSFILEHKPEWLTCVPSKIVLEKYGEIIKDVYFRLTDKKLHLTNQLKQIKKLGQQSFDIWIAEPFNFAVEFDESQHFNQFRLSTFDFYKDLKTGFNLDLYRKLSKTIIKPSTSGFTKLKKPTILFPEFLPGINQDNRIRQRAFRDVLKDLIPRSMGFNSTIRIPYHVTGKKIKKFTDADLNDVLKYLKDNELLSN